jgi:dCTP deaminase
MLTGPEIKKRVGGDIIIEPFIEAHVNPNSVDLRLDDELLVYKVCGNDVLDMAKEPEYERIYIPPYPEGLVLVPGRLYIGSTIEYTETRNLVPGIEGRSSIGRLGIDVHATAGFGDVGFKGTWTLEISVTEPVRVYPGVRVCQIYYEPVTGEIAEYTSEKYQGQRGPRPSMLWKDFANETSRSQDSEESPAE